MKRYRVLVSEVVGRVFVVTAASRERAAELVYELPEDGEAVECIDEYVVDSDVGEVKEVEPELEAA
jgi:hypothetical protein